MFFARSLLSLLSGGEVGQQPSVFKGNVPPQVTQTIIKNRGSVRNDKVFSFRRVNLMDI